MVAVVTLPMMPPTAPELPVTFAVTVPTPDAPVTEPPPDFSPITPPTSEVPPTVAALVEAEMLQLVLEM